MVLLHWNSYVGVQMDLHLISTTGVISIWRTDVFRRFGWKPTCGDEKQKVSHTLVAYFWRTGCLVRKAFG